MDKFYKKEVARNRLFDRAGNPVKFEVLLGDTGILKLDDQRDAELFKYLEGCADSRIGGVIRISAEQYDSLKKNEALKPSPPRSSLFGSQLRAMPPLDNPFSSSPPAAVSVAEAAAEVPEPRQVSTVAELRASARKIPLSKLAEKTT